MEVTFVNPGVDYMIQRITAFQTEDESAFWSEPLFHFYPQQVLRWLNPRKPICQTLL